MTANSNENDPLLAQKRLLGTLKNIVNKAEKYFEEDEGESPSTNKKDPAYKFIKSKTKSNPNWKSELNDEEKEYLKNHPSPMFERQANFHKRFLAHRRFKKGKGELIINGIKQNKQVEQSENHIEISNLENKINSTPIKDESYKNVIKQHAVLNCPNCGSSINKNDLFCGECGFKLEGIKPIQEKGEKKEENLIEFKKENNIENPINKKSSESKKEVKAQENKVNEITTEKQSHNNLPIETLKILKTFFDDQLIVESEYNILRKSALNLSNNSDCDSSSNNELIPSIKSISREKLAELKVLFDQELIDKEEYDLLRRNLLFEK